MSVLALISPLHTIPDGLYTARFIVKANQTYCYGATGEQSTVKLEDIPNRTYEFYHGNAYKTYPTGIAKLLPKTHHLCEYSIDRLDLLYNIRIEMNSFYLTKSKEDPILPSRYAYFREGELCVLGHPLLKSNDTALASFAKLEQKKREITSILQGISGPRSTHRQGV
jgi:signal peptidase I